MLDYTSDESKIRSHFFINSNHETIYILSLEQLDEEMLDFNNDFLQENVVEMKVVRASQQREYYSKPLAETIKTIFDENLKKYNDRIIYFSVPIKARKSNVVAEYIQKDKNANFRFFKYMFDDIIFYFFFNEDKSNSIEVMKSILTFFKDEYDINFNMDLEK